MHESRNKLCLSRAGRSLRQTQYPNQTIICQVQSPQVIVSPKVIGPSTNSGASSKLSGRPANFGYCVENVRLWAATQYFTRALTSSRLRLPFSSASKRSLTVVSIGEVSRKHRTDFEIVVAVFAGDASGSEKIPQPREFNDALSRHDGTH